MRSRCLRAPELLINVFHFYMFPSAAHAGANCEKRSSGYSTAKTASCDRSIMNRRGYKGQKMSSPRPGQTASRVPRITHEVSASKVFACLRTSGQPNEQVIKIGMCSVCPICSASETIYSDSARAGCEQLLAVSLVSSLAEPTPSTPSSTMSFTTDGKRQVAGPNSGTHLAFPFPQRGRR